MNTEKGKIACVHLWFFIEERQLDFPKFPETVG